MSKRRVLFLAAEPTNEVRLRLGEEQREISNALQLSRERNLKIRSRFAVRPEDVTQAIHDDRPQIVHFSGHGGERGELCLENRSGETVAVSPEALSSLFRVAQKEVECVVLNACYSATQATAIAESIRYVIGMTGAIGDKAAIAFATGFYKALAAGREYREAFEYGVVELRMRGIAEHLTPVLLVRRPAVTWAPSDEDRDAYVSLALRGRRPLEEKVLYVDPSRFSSLGHLLDAVYFNALADIVPPRSYGSYWLIEGPFGGPVVAPPSWVYQPGVAVGDVDADWRRRVTPADVGLGTRWPSLEINLDRRDLSRKTAYGLYSRYADFLKIVERHDKAIYDLKGRLSRLSDGLVVPPGNWSSKEVVVLRDWLELGLAGGVWVDEGSDEIPEEWRTMR